MSEIYTDPPQSRNEAIIKATIDGTEYTAPPQSRMEDLLLELKEVIEQGGGGGTSDYSQLSNKPSINDVTLSGNKTSSDLGLMPHYDIDERPTEDSENLVTSGGVWNADKNINNKLQGSKTAGSTDGSPFEIPDYGMTESIDMYFKPKQDTHGYDKPWAGGAGKNKLPLTIDNLKAWNTSGAWNGNIYTDGGITYTVNTNNNNVVSIKVNGTKNDGASYFICDNAFDSNALASYVVNGLPSNSGNNIKYRISNQYNFVTVQDCYNDTTIVANGTDLRFSIRIETEYNVQNVILYPMIRKSTDSADFEPYSNICPISGQDNATFEWTGKNLFDKNQTFAYNGFISSDGTLTASEFWWTTDYQPIKSGTYTMSGISSEGSAYYGICWYDSNKAYIGGFQKFDIAPQTVTIPSNAKYIRYCVNTETFNTFQLEVGNQATTYEPYTHEERTMNFGNTYYGGHCQFNGQIYPDWDYIASYNGETLSGEWVSDRDEYVAGTTPTIGAEVAYKTTPSYVRVTPPANLNLTDDYPIEYNGYMASIYYQPKNTVLAEAKKYTNQEIAKLGLPNPPTTDGTYHLECSVSGGIPTITWVSNS